MDAIHKAIRLAGNPTKLAKLSNVSQAAIWKIANGINQCSGETAVKIELGLKGAVTRDELRPDLYGKRPAA